MKENDSKHDSNKFTKLIQIWNGQQRNLFQLMIKAQKIIKWQYDSFPLEKV